jgi:hypothetical protein
LERVHVLKKRMNMTAPITAIKGVARNAGNGGFKGSLATP